MNSKAVQMKAANPLYALYLRNSKVINSIIMCIGVFVIGEIVVGIRTDNWGTFLSSTQVLITMRLAAITTFFALSQQTVISAGGGGLDLSVGNIATLSAIFGGSFMFGSNWGLIPAILIALVIGGFFGFINGFLAAYIKLPSLVVTLAVSIIVQGLINAYSANVSFMTDVSPGLRWLISGFTGPIPNNLFLIAIMIVIVTIIYNKTRLGTRILGVGSNDVVAHLSGVNVKRVRCTAFVISGIIAALGGLVLLGLLGHATREMGVNYVFPSIIVVIVGGVSLDGGEANYLSVFFAAVFLQCLTNLFIGLGWGDAGKWLGYGLVLLIMLTLYIRSKRVR
jgi:ribose transport system permease protein